VEENINTISYLTLLSITFPNPLNTKCFIFTRFSNNNFYCHQLNDRKIKFLKALYTVGPGLLISSAVKDKSVEPHPFKHLAES